jgi:glycerophosphoryl diester phosphodiesterase
VAAPHWLVARPIAHRGLHDQAQGRCENSLAAAEAAVARGFSVECDVRLSRDGVAFVFHDARLERLTGAGGRLDGLDAREIDALRLRAQGPAATPASPPRLDRLIARIAGRAPLIVEIKSAFDGDLRLVQAVARVLAQTPREAPVAVKSFDPEPIAWLRAQAPALGLERLPLGIVAQARFDAQDDWAALDAPARRDLAALTHWPRTRPDFLSWAVRDLPHAGPTLARAALGLPVMAWTVRDPQDWARARACADQAVFEGEIDG